MLFPPTLSIVEKKFQYCGLKSILSFVVGYGQFSVTKSIHSLPLRNDMCEMSKLSGLFSNLVFTRHAFGRRRKKTDPPVDYLPFPWERKKIFNQIESSGDNVRSLDVERTLPKSDLDLTETLKDLDEIVRKQFSLETADKADLREINRQLLLKKVQQHPMDFDSREVKIALQTLRVRVLLEHFKTHPKEKREKVLLIQAIHKRNKMLKMLRNVDMPRFEWIIKELDIEYTPAPLAVVTLPYTRKNDLRQLTKEYCDKLVSEKRAAYHAELKEQQKLFLKEKEEILAWIADEEKDLGITKSNNLSVS